MVSTVGPGAFLWGVCMFSLCLCGLINVYLPICTSDFTVYSSGLLQFEKSSRLSREAEDQLKVIPRFCFPDSQDWKPSAQIPRSAQTLQQCFNSTNDVCCIVAALSQQHNGNMILYYYFFIFLSSPLFWNFFC